MERPQWRLPGEAHAGQPYEWTGQTVILPEHAEMDPTFNTQPRGTQTEGDYDIEIEEPQSADEEEGETLAALVHGAGFGDGLIGARTLERHEAELNKHQLEVTTLDHKPHTFRYGNGTSDQSIKRVQLPVFIKGRRMSIRLRGVPGDVPCSSPKPTRWSSSRQMCRLTSTRERTVLLPVEPSGAGWTNAIFVPRGGCPGGDMLKTRRTPRRERSPIRLVTSPKRRLR